MTSEILLLNKSCVAIAADSAATLSGPQKVYECNKIFSLSKDYPVGIMLYQNPMISNVPAETLIKEYRKRNSGSEWRPTLEDYASDFIDFLKKESSGKSKGRMIKDESIEWHTKFLIFRVWKQLYAAFKEERRNNKKDGGNHNDNDDLFSSVMKKRLEFESKQCKASEKELKNTVSKLKRLCDDEVMNNLGHNSKVDPAKHIDRLLEIVSLMINSDEPIYESTTGVIITGFGKDDVFPKYVEYNIDGVFFGKLKYIKRKSESISEEKPSMIRPFAQDDVSNTFLNGINPDIFDSMMNNFNIILDKAVLEFAKDEIENGTTNEENIKDANKNALKKMSINIQENIKNRYYYPIEDSVSFMSKTEMARMAESMISITALRRRASMYETESVGGPVDIAVVSRGEGLIWIKRKHYFNMEYNPQYRWDR